MLAPTKQARKTARSFGLALRKATSAIARKPLARKITVASGMNPLRIGMHTAALRSSASEPPKASRKAKDQEPNAGQPSRAFYRAKMFGL